MRKVGSHLVAFGLLSCFAMCWPGAESVRAAIAFCIQEDIEALEEEAILAAVERVAPSVIRFETIGGNNRVDGRIVPSGPSTGFVVSEDGYVVSASFHFAHNPASILTTLPDGKKAAAEIVGRDLSRKIVLLKIDSDFQFEVAQSVDAAKIDVGQTVVAIGRVFDEATTNVSTGIVSAKGRVWNRAIQTDAKISPANFGGPLTDLAGNVIGILVPMSPDDDSEMAGTEWYDSGIGFAVPMADVMGRMDELKAGKTLRPGLLGVSLEGSDVYADPAVVAFYGANTPAGKVGIVEGDEITKVNGQVVRRQAELKHALGPLYEGDKIEVVVKRDDEELSFDIELVGELEPFVAPAIGVLLDSGKSGAVIEHVAQGSSASDAGLKKGDKIIKYGGLGIGSRSELRNAILKAKIGSEVSVEVERDDGQEVLTVTVAKQTANLFEFEKMASEERKYSVVRIQVADSKNKCFAVVPEVANENQKPSLLVWIPKPGKLSKEEIEKVWLDRCKNHYSIVLIPESTDPKRWQPDDVAFVSSAIENLNKQFVFERSKVVVAGHKTGGTMASLIAFQNRSLFKGLAMIDAAASTRIARFSTSPVEPLLILIGSGGGEIEGAIAETVEALGRAKIPFVLEKKKPVLESWIGDVLTWAWTIDRL